MDGAQQDEYHSNPSSGGGIEIDQEDLNVESCQMSDMDKAIKTKETYGAPFLKSITEEGSLPSEHERQDSLIKTTT